LNVKDLLNPGVENHIKSFYCNSNKLRIFLILKENEKEKRTNQIAKRGILFQNELLATLPKLTHH